MDDTRDKIIRPRQVTIAVTIILVSAGVLVLATVTRHWGSWDSLLRLLPLSLLLAAGWTFLAWRIARCREWARVTFATFALLELFTLPWVLQAVTVASLLGGVTPVFRIVAWLQVVKIASVLGTLATVLRIVAVFLLFRPSSDIVFRPPGRVERSWVFPLILISVLVAQLVLLLAASYYVAKDAATGEWHRALGTIFLDLISLAIAIAFCLTRNTFRRLFAKVAVVLLAIVTPKVAQALLPISEPLVAYRLERDRYRDFKSFMEAWKAEKAYYAQLRDWQQGRGPFPETPKPVGPAAIENPARELHRAHTAELKALFKTKQRVLAAGERFLILENGHCVVIYGIDAAPRQTSAFRTFAEQNIVGGTVDIRLPEHHANIYIPGEGGRLWSGLEYGEPRDPRGRLYGEVQGLVFFDGRLLNLDYCRPQSRDVFTDYQQAYESGEL